MWALTQQGSSQLLDFNLVVRKKQPIIRTPLISYFSCFIPLFLVPGEGCFIHIEHSYDSPSVCKGCVSDLHFWKAFFASTCPVPCPETWTSVCTAMETTAKTHIFVRIWSIPSAQVPAKGRDFIWEGDDPSFGLTYGSVLLLGLGWICKASLSIKLCPPAQFASGSAILAPSEKYSEILFCFFFQGLGGMIS